MPSSKITADETDQVYIEGLTCSPPFGWWLRRDFQGVDTSASTVPDSLSVHYFPYSSPSLPFQAKD
jgi:hypothetical protein